MISKIINKLLDLFFPKTCINCGDIGEYLCQNCKKKLIPHPEICPYCHKKSEDYVRCHLCKTDSNNLEGLIINFAYNGSIKNLIIKLKYNHTKNLTDFLSDRLILGLKSNSKLTKSINCSKTTYITYIPSHRYRKYFKKGYNQSELLAQNISKKMGIPYIKLLKKPQSSKSQVKLKRNERFINIKNKFIYNPDSNLKGDETIIIVDDITTTGATINEAAKTIKTIFPNTKLRGIVLARH